MKHIALKFMLFALLVGVTGKLATAQDVVSCYEAYNSCYNDAEDYYYGLLDRCADVPSGRYAACIDRAMDARETLINGCIRRYKACLNRHH